LYNDKEELDEKILEERNIKQSKFEQFMRNRLEADAQIKSTSL
jgi:hypothetical protein